MSKSENRDMVLKTLDTVVERNAPILMAQRLDGPAFKRVAMNAFIQQPALFDVPPADLVRGFTRAVQYGMLPDGVSGIVVPIKRRGALSCEFWPMIGGLLTKVRAELPHVAIGAQSVYRGETFIDERGTSPKLTHQIPQDVAIERTPANLVAVYATAFHPGNPVPEFEVLYRSDLDRYPTLARVMGGPMAKHLAEWAEVRALKLLLKRLPVSPTLQSVLAGEDDGEPEAEPEAVQQPTAVIIDAPVQQAEQRKTRASTKKKAAPKPEPQPEPEPEIEDEPEPEAEDEPYDLKEW